jgi:hypothetical protein
MASKPFKRTSEVASSTNQAAVITANSKQTSIPTKKIGKTKSTKATKHVPEGVEIISPRFEYPPDFLKINEDSRDLFQFSTEIDPDRKSATYGKEFPVVTFVTFETTTGKKFGYDLITMWNHHLRQLARQLGVKNISSATKFECRRGIATILQYHKEIAATGIHPRTVAGLAVSSICRATNIVFSESFIESFRTINCHKTRRDHETGNMPKDFWSDASLCYNEVKMETSEDILVSALH